MNYERTKIECTYCKGVCYSLTDEGVECTACYRIQTVENTKAILSEIKILCICDESVLDESINLCYKCSCGKYNVKEEVEYDMVYKEECDIDEIKVDEPSIGYGTYSVNLVKALFLR